MTSMVQQLLNKIYCRHFLEDKRSLLYEFCYHIEKREDNFVFIPFACILSTYKIVSNRTHRKTLNEARNGTKISFSKEQKRLREDGMVCKM